MHRRDQEDRRQGGGRRCLIDRSGGKAKVGVPLIALAEWKVQAWPADKLPPHLRNISPAVKPGSMRPASLAA